MATVAGDRLGAELFVTATPNQQRRLLVEATDMAAVTAWAQAFSELAVRRLVERWNETRLTVYLGIALVRGITLDDLRGVKFDSNVKIEGAAFATLVRALPSLPKGSGSLAACIEHGLCRNDETREVVARALRERPAFLFDDVLPRARVEEFITLDFIRLLFTEWASYRGVPLSEARAIEGLWSRNLFAKLKALLGG
jgi:hypothetical protein